MSVDENKVLARHWNEEIWSKANLSVIEDYLAPNFVFNYAPPGMVPIIEAYKIAVNMFHNACPDMKYEIEDIIGEGDKVMVRWVGRGTQKGEIMGVAPTGKPVTVTGISVLQIEEGKIAREWTEMDMLGVFQQLGAFPS